MAGNVVNSSFVDISKFGLGGQELASKTATSHLQIVRGHLKNNQTETFEIDSSVTNPISHTLVTENVINRPTDQMNGFE